MVTWNVCGSLLVVPDDSEMSLNGRCEVDKAKNHNLIQKIVSLNKIILLVLGELA